MSFAGKRTLASNKEILTRHNDTNVANFATVVRTCHPGSNRASPKPCGRRHVANFPNLESLAHRLMQAESNICQFDVLQEAFSLNFLKVDAKPKTKLRKSTDNRRPQKISFLVMLL